MNTAILEAFWTSEPLAVFIALILVGLSKLLKHRRYVKLNGVKNPNWLDTNQLTIFQLGLRISTQDYREEVQLAVRAGLNMGPSNCRYVTLPPWSSKRLLLVEKQRSSGGLLIHRSSFVETSICRFSWHYIHSPIKKWEARRELEPKCVSQLLLGWLLSLVTIPEVFAKVIST